MLSAERERNVRLVRRAATEPHPGLEDAVQIATRPLWEKIARLEAELNRRPAAAKRDQGVTRIRGIGPKIAGILAGVGITTIRDIARLTGTDIERIKPLLPVYPGRIDDDQWVEQARQMIADEGDPPLVG